MQVNTRPSNRNGFGDIAGNSIPYHPSDSWGLEGPLNHSSAGALSGRLMLFKRE